MSMIQVSGRTYRIHCVAPGTYDAVRLLDDVRIGSFGGGPSLRLDAPVGADAGPESLLRQIAQTAIRLAKTRWTATPHAEQLAQSSIVDNRLIVLQASAQSAPIDTQDRGGARLVAVEQFHSLQDVPAGELDER